MTSEKKWETFSLVQPWIGFKDQKTFDSNKCDAENRRKTDPCCQERDERAEELVELAALRIWTIRVHAGKLADDHQRRDDKAHEKVDNCKADDPEVFGFPQSTVLVDATQEADIEGCSQQEIDLQEWLQTRRPHRNPSSSRWPQLVVQGWTDIFAILEISFFFNTVTIWILAKAKTAQI